MKLVEASGRQILFVMAVDAEYGPELARHFSPLFTGVGPVEAATAMSACLAGSATAGRMPDLVVSLGSAGSAVLPQTEIFQVASVSYRDMDASALGFVKGATPFLDIPVELPLETALLPDVPAKRLSTGANIVSGPAYKSVEAEMGNLCDRAILHALRRSAHGAARDIRRGD